MEEGKAEELTDEEKLNAEEEKLMKIHTKEIVFKY